MDNKLWIARDEDGNAYIHYTKPSKGEHGWCSGHVLGCINANHFNEIKWSDEEPTEIEIVVKQKSK